jgi:hypothetical protein
VARRGSHPARRPLNRTERRRELIVPVGPAFASAAAIGLAIGDYHHLVPRNRGRS